MSGALLGLRGVLGRRGLLLEGIRPERLDLGEAILDLDLRTRAEPSPLDELRLHRPMDLL